MANKRPLVVDDLGGGIGSMREAGVGELAALIGSPYCTYGGTANTIALTVNEQMGKPSAYVAGAQYRFRATLANTGAATVNVDGIGAKPLVTVTGVALPAGYIRTSVDTTITYDAAGDRFVADRVIESGTNSNGVYERFADGTQRCRFFTTLALTASTAYGALFAGTSYDWTFPAAFSANNWSATILLGRSLATAGNCGYAIIDVDVKSTTALRFMPFMTLSTTNAGSHLHLTAEGYWYS